VLRAGGLVVPVELDIPAARSLPATPMVSQALAWIVEAFAKGGIQPSLGPRLWAIAREAGLRPLGISCFRVSRVGVMVRLFSGGRGQAD